MDWRPYIFIYDVVKLPESFEKWRENVIKESLRLCKKLEKVPRKNTTAAFYHVREGVIRLPKTMVRLTRQMCDCDEYCTQYSLYYTKFSEDCKFYDLKNLMEDDKYYRSVLQYRKVINRHLEHENLKIEDKAVSAALHNGIWDLCDNKKDSLIKLKCKIYDLKDHCRKNEDCYKNIIEEKSPYSYSEYNIHNNLCINPRFQSELKAIETKFDLPEFYANIKSKNDKLIIKRNINTQYNGNQYNRNQYTGSLYTGSLYNGNQYNGNQFNENQYNANQFNGNQISDNSNVIKLAQVPLLLSLIIFFLMNGKNYKVLGLVLFSIICLAIAF